jgi:hypothetical protein
MERPIEGKSVSSCDAQDIERPELEPEVPESVGRNKEFYGMVQGIMS